MLRMSVLLLSYWLCRQQLWSCGRRCAACGLRCHVMLRACVPSLLILTRPPVP